MDTKTLLQDGDIEKEEEDLIFNPFNSNNREITEDEVCDILKKYGVPDKVHNINLYKFMVVMDTSMIMELNSLLEMQELQLFMRVQMVSKL